MDKLTFLVKLLFCVIIQGRKVCKVMAKFNLFSSILVLCLGVLSSYPCASIMGDSKSDARVLGGN